jgi:hypothetical protein
VSADVDLDVHITDVVNVLRTRAYATYHIVCTPTLATRDSELMAKARAEGRLWTVDTGHDLMITEPKKVADALLEVAADAHGIP